MNRREALASLMSLPAVTRISVAQLKPDDVIVIECDERLSENQAAHLNAYTQKTWPDRKVVVLDKGLKMKIVSG